MRTTDPYRWPALGEPVNQADAYEAGRRAEEGLYVPNHVQREIDRHHEESGIMRSYYEGGNDALDDIHRHENR